MNTGSSPQEHKRSWDERVQDFSVAVAPEWFQVLEWLAVLAALRLLTATITSPLNSVLVTLVYSFSNFILFVYIAAKLFGGMEKRADPIRGIKRRWLRFLVAASVAILIPWTAYLLTNNLVAELQQIAS